MTTYKKQMLTSKQVIILNKNHKKQYLIIIILFFIILNSYQDGLVISEYKIIQLIYNQILNTITFLKKIKY